jgi:hypothetical protein
MGDNSENIIRYKIKFKKRLKKEKWEIEYDYINEKDMK